MNLPLATNTRTHSISVTPLTSLSDKHQEDQVVLADQEALAGLEIHTED